MNHHSQGFRKTKNEAASFNNVGMISKCGLIIVSHTDTTLTHPLFCWTSNSVEKNVGGKCKQHFSLEGFCPAEKTSLNVHGMGQQTLTWTRVPLTW